jgi:hypothetical protein
MHGQTVMLEDVAVSRSRLDILVAQEFLHGAAKHVVVVFQQVGGKAVAKGVGAGRRC